MVEVRLELHAWPRGGEQSRERRGAIESWILPGEGLSRPRGDVSPMPTSAVGLPAFRPA